MSRCRQDSILTPALADISAWRSSVPASLRFPVHGGRRHRVFPPALIVALLHVVVVWCFAAIAETRVFVPVLPLLLPPALHVFVDTDGDRG